jgi:hypothetical protein
MDTSVAGDSIMPAIFCPIGFQKTVVYDMRNGKRERIYHDVVIPRKSTREKIQNESILVSDAVRLAQATCQ